MRLRFAPSPTGSLHLGNVRTAIANWLEARRLGGTLVLRIEDTDADRSQEEAETAILRDLEWLGLDWDEGPDRSGEHGPYRQSARGERYRKVLAQLLGSGHAYRCFCGPASGDGAWPEAGSAGCRGGCPGLGTDEVEERLEAGEPASTRVRVPAEAIRFDDGLRGETGVAVGEIDDFVVARADGTATYQLAVVVDDHDMEIDHVIRGQDHLSNTPRQLVLYRAMGWRPPRFTHLPLVLGGDGARLSKRHGATSVADLRGAGILPTALVNYLALLGWEPPGGEEILMPRELMQVWRVEATSPTNLGLDPAKLEWVNQQHLGRLEADEVLERAEPFLARAGVRMGKGAGEREWWRQAIDLVRGSVHRLDELPEALAPLVEPEIPSPEEVGDPAVRHMLRQMAAASRAGELEGDGFRTAAKVAGAESGLKGRELYHPLRLALTGRDSGPELARMVPLMETGNRLDLDVEVPGVADRIETVLGEGRGR